MRLDSQLFGILHHRAGDWPLLDRPALVLARFGACAEIALMLLATAERGRRGALGRALGAVALVYALSETIGRCVRRSRPFAAEPLARRLLAHEPDRSFPSRHV